MRNVRIDKRGKRNNRKYSWEKQKWRCLKTVK